MQSARSMGSTVGRVLVEMGRLTEEQLARATAERHGIPYARARRRRSRRRQSDQAQRGQALPRRARRLRARWPARGDGRPEDALGINDIALMTKLDVHPAVAAPPAIEALLEGLPLPSAADVAAPVNGGEDEAAVTSEDRGESGSGGESGLGGESRARGARPGSWGESSSGAESGSGVFWQADFEPPETSPSSCARWSRRALRRARLRGAATGPAALARSAGGARFTRGRFLMQGANSTIRSNAGAATTPP